jgi:hypothetical protein
MKNALISPNESVSYISGWTDAKYPLPIYSIIPNAERIPEVVNTTFEVALPLFWVSCADDVVADQYYYNSVSATIEQIPPSPPYPELTQPSGTGTQTL